MFAISTRALRASMFALVLSISPVAFVAEALASTPYIKEAEDKPYGEESLAKAKAQCQRMSERAKVRETKLLLVGFEGAACYEESTVRQAYRYQYLRELGENPRRPVGGAGGFVTQALVLPLIERFGSEIEYLILPQSASNSVGETIPSLCTKIWLKGAPDRRVALVGHSWGGHAAILLLNTLARFKVKVKLAMTLDAVGKIGGVRMARTRNVEHFENYYQTSPLYLHGYPIPGADVNLDLDKYGAGYGHGKLPHDPKILRSLESWMPRLIK